MRPVPLPEHVTLERLEEGVELLRGLVEAGDDDALDMVRSLHPAALDAADPAVTISAFGTADAQLVTARLHGFASWDALRRHVAVVVAHSWTEPADDHLVEPADRFVSFACAHYGGGAPDRLATASAMLDADPSLARSSIASLAACGLGAELEAACADDPGLVDRPTGPHGWPPILWCTYGRLVADGGAAADTLRRLLARGADPNAGFLWHGLVPPFTALTGALGGGERDQPPHPDAHELARLLLEAGADPNDGQALYNRGLAGTASDDPSHLELLCEHGLGGDVGGPWYARLGSRLTPPTELLHDELEVAAARGLPRRMRFLVELGLDLERPVGRAHQPPLRIAAHHGHGPILEILAAAGVEIDLSPEERCLVIVRSGSTSELDALLSSRAAVVAELRAATPDLIARIASVERLPMIERLIALGFDVGAGDVPALHAAAHRGDGELVDGLLRLGADPTRRDRHHDATAADWAEHGGHADLALMLAKVSD